MSELLLIETVPVTALAQNARIVHAPGGGDALLIDPGGDAELLSQRLDALQLVPRAIWLTHSHFDHCGGVADLKMRWPLRLYGHAAGRELRTSVVEYCTMFGVPAEEVRNCPEPDEYVSQGARLSFAGFDFEVLYTPGHSPDHVCFYCPRAKVVFTGDVLFAGSIGRSDFPGGSGSQLMRSIKQQLLRLPGDTKVFAGHGPDTVIKREIDSNPFLQE